MIVTQSDLHNNIFKPKTGNAKGGCGIAGLMTFGRDERECANNTRLTHNPQYFKRSKTFSKNTILCKKAREHVASNANNRNHCMFQNIFKTSVVVTN